MDQNQQKLIELLSSAIHSQQSNDNRNDSIDWDYIFEESVAHQVHTVLYPVVNRLEPGHGPDSALMAKWQSITVYTAVTQFQHIQQIGEVLNKFHQEQIPVIALKGLIIREYYPKPELRTMGDADLLIHKEDMDQVNLLLIDLGYLKGKTGTKHISYNHKLFPSIEVHLFLLDGNKFSFFKDFTESVWANAITTKINGAAVLALSPEDQVLHLILHMANHMKSSGFGLRQLCDLALYIYKNSEHINWLIVSNKIVQYRITQFTCAIFTLCNRLFQLTIPEIFNMHSNSPYIDELITDILAGGVFGKRGQERIIGLQMLDYIKNCDSASVIERIHRVCSFAFPSHKRLYNRYRYAKKYPILLPVAWIDRFIYNLSRKNMITYLKTTYSKDKNSTFERRSKLLRWLELR